MTDPWMVVSDDVDEAGGQWIVVVDFITGEQKAFRGPNAAEILTVALFAFETELEVGNAVRMTLTYEGGYVS